MADRLVKVGGSFVSLGGGGGSADKVLDEAFDSDFSAFSAPESGWGLGTDLTDWSISTDHARVASSAGRGLLWTPPAPIFNSLQIVTWKTGDQDSANRIRLFSRVIAGELTAIDFNNVPASGSSNNQRVFLFDDGAANSVTTGRAFGSPGDFFASVLLTIGELAIGFNMEVDATAKDPRGEWPGGAGSASAPATLAVTDANTGWPAELDAGSAGGGFILGTTGAMFPASATVRAEIHRWEVWDLGT